MTNKVTGFVAAIGRPFVGTARGFASGLYDGVASLGAMTLLLRETFYWIFVGPFRGKTRFRSQVFSLMQQIGVRSLFIVCLVSLLVGGILVLQTADKFEQFGSKTLVAPMVCVAMIRELGPLMTAIVIAGRVGAAFTAGLGSMVINEEVLALKTMGINPVAFLVAPRYIAIGIMLPCLTMYSYLIGIIGGLLTAATAFDIDFYEYLNATRQFIAHEDLIAGLFKAFVFASIICMVSCYQALNVRGGPEGVGRNTMISVVNSLVSIIIADAVIGLMLARWIY